MLSIRLDVFLIKKYRYPVHKTPRYPWFNLTNNDRFKLSISDQLEGEIFHLESQN